MMTKSLQSHIIVLQLNIECLICYSFYCKYSYDFVLKLYNIIITIIIESFFCPTVGKFTVFFFFATDTGCHRGRH